MLCKLTATILVVGGFLIAAPAAFAKTIDVSTVGADAPGCGTGVNPSCASIQYAIDNVAANGDTISVAAGTYDVTSTVDVDKQLTIDGAGDGIGSGGTTVEPPSPSTGFTPDGAPDPAPGCPQDYAVLYVGPAGSGSTVENLTVDGNEDGDAGQASGGNFSFIGVDVYDASATLNGDQISGAEAYPFGGAQCEDDLQADDDNGATDTLTAEDLNINNYQKNGAAFWGAGLTANVSDSTVTGVGPTPHLAANGIVYSDGAGGTVSGSTVTGNECDEANACGPDEFTVAQADGILAFQSGSVTLSGDTLDGNDTGFFFGYPDSGTGSVINSVIDDNRFQGLLLNQGTTNASRDEISGSEYGVQVLSFDKPSDPPDTGNAVANLSNDTITRNTDGIEADDDVTSSPTAYPVITANNDQITQNSTAGFANDVQKPQDATNNYWGCPSGPGGAGCDPITGIGASMVSYVPFIGSATPLPPGLTAAFGQTTMPLGGRAPLTFTIANPNAATGLTGIGFSDTLPAGLSIASPNGISGSCGSGTITAASGSSSISLADGTLAAGSSCTFSVQVTPTTTGSKTDRTSAVSSNEGGSGNAATASTTVVGVPTVALVAPQTGTTYAFGRVVPANYSCEEAANGPGIASCTGSVADDVPINTKTAGQHTFTVTATSSDGLTATRSVTYTVLPNNKFTISHIKTARAGSVSFHYAVPGPGALTALLTVSQSLTKGPRATVSTATVAPAPGRAAIGRAVRGTGQTGSGSFVVHFNRLGLKLLQDHPGGFPIRLYVVYLPTGGTEQGHLFVRRFRP